MNDFIFNETENAERPRLMICGFSESYREMLELLFSGEMTVCSSEPHIIIAEEGFEISARSIPAVIIGKTEGRRKGRLYFKRPVDLKKLRRAVLSLAVADNADSETRELHHDSEALTVSLGGKTAQLTSLEFALFLLLYNNRGEVVSREKIRESLWQEQSGSNVCDVYVCYLRKKLEALMGKGCIVSLRGKGYMLREAEK